MHTLDRYITRQANRSIAVVIATLLSLISLFALFEELDENELTYGLKEAVAYVVMTMPRRFDEVLVYGLFLGYLIALGRFAETNELTICRVSGMSPARLCLSLAPSMLLWLVLLRWCLGHRILRRRRRDLSTSYEHDTRACMQRLQGLEP